MSETIFKRHCYVVRQQDANWPYLTARETLMFAAELYKVTEDMESTVLLVDELMCKMGLVSCKDTKCCRLSGGQQRRLSLAVALLKQPSVLFLDEPTSGLDACSASMIMKKISRVAKRENLIIICTIHQPSTKVFEGFDRLMILSKGREAFVGDAKQAVNHFRSIGYPLPQQTNPAEHFLDICNADFSSNAEVDKILDSWAHQKVTSSLLKHEYVALPDLNDDRQPTLKHQTRVMFRRHLKLILRDPVLYAGRVLACLVVNSIFGIVYIAARNYDQDQAINKLWVSGWYIGRFLIWVFLAMHYLHLKSLSSTPSC
jgi:ABC-type multidrug transport system ATPase subunit